MEKSSFWIKKQVNVEITTYTCGKFKPTLLDVLLLMIITTTLTTIHSESSPQTTLPSSPQKSIQDGDSPSPSESPTGILDRHIRRTTSGSEVESKMYGFGTKQQQKHFVFGFNNAALGLRGSNLQLKQHHQETNANGQSMQSIEHVNLDGSQNFSSNNFSVAAATASPQTTTQILIENEDETIVPDSIHQNENKKFISSYSLPLEGEPGQKQQVSGGLSTEDSGFDISEANDSPDSQLSSSSSPLFKRRFGLFKKGQHQNKNLPYSSFVNGMANGGMFSYFNDCESCLSNSDLTSYPKNPVWLYEQSFRQPTKMVFPQSAYHYGHQIPHQFSNFAHIKSKFNKFSKPSHLAMMGGDFYYGHNSYPTGYRSKVPITSRPIPYNCIQSELLSSSSEVSNQDSLEKSKPSEQELLSYHPNLQY